MSVKYAAIVILNRMIQLNGDIGPGAKLRLYAGLRPADGDEAITSQQFLAEFNCGGPFGTATSSALVAVGIGPTRAAQGGDPSFYRLFRADGVTPICDGDVGTDLVLDASHVDAGQTMSLTSFVITGATGSAIQVVPGAISVIVANSPGSTTQPLVWAAPTIGTTPITYTIEYRLTGGTTYTQAAIGVFSTNYTVSGLTPSTAYDYRVTPVNGGGPGQPALVSAVTAATTASVPGTPTAVVATAGDGQVSVAFSAPSSNGGQAITDYLVTVTGGGTHTNHGATSPIVVAGLTNGVGVTATVHAINPVGPSAESAASASVTPGPVTDTRPRYGVGLATAGVTNGAALLASMTKTGANGSVAATFTVSPDGTHYGFFAALASACVNGVTFTDAQGTGGWQGASFPGNPDGTHVDDGSSPNTSSVIVNDGTDDYRIFRQSYAGAVDTQTTS